MTFFDPYAGPPEKVQGAGPEQAQRHRLRAIIGRALMGSEAAHVVGGSPAGNHIVTGDTGNPQPTVRRPDVTDAVATTPSAIVSSRYTLPSRLSPSSWDGEAGYTAAIAGEL